MCMCVWLCVCIGFGLGVCIWHVHAACLFSILLSRGLGGFFAASRSGFVGYVGADVFMCGGTGWVNGPKHVCMTCGWESLRHSVLKNMRPHKRMQQCLK